MRNPSEKEYFHDRMGDAFADALSDYDTKRRLEILIDDFLTDDMVKGKRALDVGCGLGFFSERLHHREAKVTAVDLGENLVEHTRKRVGCECRVADALQLASQLGREQFDLVVSSECIEHTPDPMEAVRQMVATLKPGGILAISTPNVVWYPVVKLATILKARPFHGLENFTSWRRMRKTLAGEDIEVIREFGLHLFPFQLGMHGASTWCDNRFQSLRGCMINMCILGRKKRW